MEFVRYKMNRDTKKSVMIHLVKVGGLLTVLIGLLCGVSRLLVDFPVWRILIPGIIGYFTLLLFEWWELKINYQPSFFDLYFENKLKFWWKKTWGFFLLIPMMILFHDIDYLYISFYFFVTKGIINVIKVQYFLKKEIQRRNGLCQKMEE